MADPQKRRERGGAGGLNHESARVPTARTPYAWWEYLINYIIVLLPLFLAISSFPLRGGGKTRRGGTAGMHAR